MKYKTTKKAIQEGYFNVKSAGYCDLQYLFWGLSPIAYTSGICGWDFDVYDLGGVVICTGYRGMPGKRADGISEYNEKARATVENYDMPYEEKREKIGELVKEFVALNK